MIKQKSYIDSPNESPNESLYETEKEVNNYDNLIKGAFILCIPYKKNKYSKDPVFIKLSSINSIHPCFEDYKEQKFCFFRTYKDQCYAVELYSHQLRRAIDTFLFHPEDHWEQYSYD